LAMSTNRATKSRIRSDSRQEGYLLLSVMLLITLMLIALAIAVPRIAQQIKRQKEEELIHRGKEYANAIKKFYHKNGTYPTSLDQLESTNNQRFLRHRFKDPMTEKGEWKLIHVGEAQINMPTPASPGGIQTPGQTGSLNTTFPGTQLGAQPSPGQTGSAPAAPGGFSPGGFNPGGGQTGGTQVGGTQPGGGGQLGTLNTSNIGTGLGANAQGGGPIIGVASTSTNKSIKEFNGVNEYDQWLFVYDPRLEQGPGGGGVSIGSPRTGSPTSGAVPAGIFAPTPAPTPVQNPPVGGTPGSPTAPQQPNATPTPQRIPQ